MNVFTILRNLVQGIKSALQESKDYTDAGLADKLTVLDFKLGSLTDSTTVSGGGTAWGSVDIPSGQKLIAPSGIYWYGSNNTNCMLYAFQQNNGVSIAYALRNWGSASASLTVNIQYIYIEE